VRCAERADLKRCQRAGGPSAQVAGGNLIGKAAFAQIEFAADSPLEGGVWCELVSEFLESIKRGPNH